MLFFCFSLVDNVFLLEDSKSKFSVSCLNCGGSDVRANGNYKGFQRYQRKDCKKVFQGYQGKAGLWT